MTETQSPERAGRRRRFDFEEIVPADVTVRAEQLAPERLIPGREYTLDPSRPLAVGEGYDIMGAIRADEKMFYVLDLRKTEAAEDGTRMIDDIPIEGDFMLVSDESGTYKSGYAAIHEPRADAVSERNPNGNFRVGRNYLRDSFACSEYVSAGHFDIRLTPEGGVLVSDVYSSNGTSIVQGPSIEAAYMLPGHEQELPAQEEEVAGAEARQDSLPHEAAETKPATSHESLEGEALALSDIFESSASLRSALQQPDRMHPTEYAALQEIVAAWHELQVAGVAAEEWKKLQKLARQVQEEADAESRHLNQRLAGLENLKEGVVRTRGKLDAIRPQDVSPLSEGEIPQFSMPETSTAQDSLAQAAESARLSVRAAAGAAEQELTEDRAAALADAVRKHIQPGQTMNGILADMRGLLEDANPRWFRQLQSVEELLAYARPPLDETQNYRRLAVDLSEMNESIRRGNYGDAYDSASRVRAQMDPIIDSAYQRRALVLKVAAGLQV